MDPPFSRYPDPWFYSELLYITWSKETGILGYWANLQAYRAILKLVPATDTELLLTYNYLRANENTYGGTSIFSPDGKKRGDLIQTKLSHSFTKKLDGYLLVEDFVPGNYYKETNRDNSMFIRWELQWKI